MQRHQIGWQSDAELNHDAGQNEEHAAKGNSRTLCDRDYSRHETTRSSPRPPIIGYQPLSSESARKCAKKRESRPFRDMIHLIKSTSIDHFTERKMSQKNELKNRVEAKKLKLQAKVKELRANASSDSREEIKKLEARLDDLSESVKDGWDDLTEKVSGKLNQWLKDD